mmetsp:Transcript_16798/g.32153  ORF Transcript_16798/g.32153 Transcript_16798/m.32153 type:complete len:284 (+) Transcript_16798:311-1162(+)
MDRAAGVFPQHRVRAGGDEALPIFADAVARAPADGGQRQRLGLLAAGNDVRLRGGVCGGPQRRGGHQPPARAERRRGLGALLDGQARLHQQHLRLRQPHVHRRTHARAALLGVVRAPSQDLPRSVRAHGLRQEVRLLPGGRRVDRAGGVLHRLHVRPHGDAAVRLCQQAHGGAAVGERARQQLGLLARVPHVRLRDCVGGGPERRGRHRAPAGGSQERRMGAVLAGRRRAQREPAAAGVGVRRPRLYECTNLASSHRDVLRAHRPHVARAPRPLGARAQVCAV